MKSKIWGGRFAKPQSRKFEEYCASIGFDWELAECDILLNIAHAKSLQKAGIIKRPELSKIVNGLNKIAKEISTGNFKFRVEDEDIHMNIERRLTERIGSLAGKLHTGRSRNDQVVTDLRLYTRNKIREILKELKVLQKTLLRQAEKNINIIMPAYTHMQQAQPVRVAHWFLAYQQMFSRDVERFEENYKRTNLMPLGSGALAGVNFNLDRRATAKLLGFDGITRNSLDAVGDRDFALEFCFAVSVFFSHLSRLAEEIIIFSTDEFRTLTLPDELCTGSSIMPQKKNPDLAELFRGKTGRVTGNLMNLLVLMKGLPLAYNKDLQEDKPPIFDSAKQALDALPLAAELVKNITFNKKVLKERIKGGYTVAVDLADYLAMKGMPFRKAHHVVGNIVRECEEKGVSFSDLTLEDLQKKSKLFKRDVSKFTDPSLSPDRKKGEGSTSRQAIQSQINRLKKELR